MKKTTLIFLAGLSLTLIFSGCKNEKPDTQKSLQKQETITTSTTTTTKGPVQKELSLIMVGDMLLHTPVEESALQADGIYSYDAVFAHTKEEIAKADIAIANQEVIIGGKNLGVSGYPAFNAPFEMGHDLVEAGFDVICHGTNHALDKGKKGLLSCVEFWETNYPQIGVLGIHDSQEDRDNLYFYEKDGVKIAILNYTYGTNGIPLPSGMPYAVDMLEEEQVAADIRRAETEADFTIVCPHWGTEYKLEPSAQQKKWTDIFLREGVDLVLGTHPHVIEPIEWVTDEATAHKMLVYYSLGNFVNWTSGTGTGVSNRMVGGMAQVTLSWMEYPANENQNTKPEIADYDVLPLVSHVTDGTNGVTVYPFEKYSPQLAKQNEIRSQAKDFSYEYCEKLLNKVWGELWKEQ